MSSRNCVLLVEDNRDALTGLFTLLSDAGFSVLTATDGEDAVDFLERGIRPDLVIVDLLMRRVTGWEVIEYLQRDPALREVPVIVMTALDSQSAHVVGADLVLNKPIQPGELLEAVHRLLQQPHSHAS